MVDVKEMLKPRTGMRRLPISAELLAGMFRDGNEIQAKVTDGLPADASIVDVKYDAVNRQVYLILGSITWDGDWNQHDDIDVTLKDLR